MKPSDPHGEAMFWKQWIAGVLLTPILWRSLLGAGVSLFLAGAIIGGQSSATVKPPARPAQQSEKSIFGRPSFHIHTDEDGLPQKVIECLAFDRQGYLWVGTQNGAAYYNGRIWTTVNLPNSTASNYVFTILATADGSIWFGTQTAGLSRLKDGKWETFDKSNSPLPHNEVRTLLEVAGPNNSTALWVGTGGGGVARYEAGQWTAFNTVNSALRSDRVRALVATTSPSGSQTVWVGTLGGGLARYENGQWTTFDPTNSGLPTDQIRCVVADAARTPQPALWIGTTGGGLVRYESGQWSVFNTKNSGLPSDVVRSLARTASPTGDILWVGTNGNGLARFEAGHWTTYDTTNSDLPKNAVLSLLGDVSSSNNQSLWIGTLDGGLAHYAPGGWTKIDKKNAPLPDQQIWSLLETISPSGGTIYWFGTTTGLARMEDGKWSTFSTGNSPLPNDYVLSLLETESATGQRALWIGTNGGGLARLEAGRWTIFNAGNSGLPGNVVIALLQTTTESGNHVIWAGTEGNGLACYENGQWSAFNTSNSGLPDNKVLTLLETTSSAGQRALWVGANGGLARYENGKWTSFTTSNSALPNNQVWGLRETLDDAGRRQLWVGTAGGGVARFNQTPSGDGFDLTQATFKAFANYTVWQIQTDAKKRIYLSTDKGIAQLTPRRPTAEDAAEYSVYTFTTEDGLPSNGCNQGAFIADSRGRFWVGTGDGAAVFDPNGLGGDLNPKPLLIERTLQGGKEKAFPDRASFAYNENNFQFEFALLSYFRERDTRYRFQLAGFDSDASDWTTESRKEYTNLGEGDYVFNVWARDYAGNVSGPVSKAFSIRSAPWRTWWAYGFYVLGIGLLAFAAVRVQVGRVQRKAVALLEKQKEKARLREAELRAEAAELQAQAIEAENRRKGEELNFARELQLSMLPKQNVLLEKMEIVGQMRTATEVGGDYYDFIKIDDHHYCVAIGDATGHGVGAGLVVGMVKTALLNSVLRFGPEARAEQLIADLNQTLKASITHRGVGMCLSIALIDLGTMTAEIGSTGMPFPCFYQGRTGQVETIEMPGPPLGYMKKINPRTHTIQLTPKDRLIFMSDGFNERMNGAGECWGDESVTNEIARICRAEADGEAIASRLIAACDEFAQGRESDDDMTVMVICVNGHKETGSAS